MPRMGRPREFDWETALDRAIDTFYAKGYEATTLDDLTAAMGIKRPSLYATFGNKEALFLQALERYGERAALEAQTALTSHRHARESVEAFLYLAAEWHVQRSRMMGCLIANSSSDCREEQPTICKRIQQLHQRNEEILYQRLQQGIEAGELSQNADIRGLAQFFNGVTQGMAVLARGQHNPEAIWNMAKFSMGAWPDS
ncbi:MAG: TetR/AcrR family transcriptional regulator [Leptolyngbyaceae cyanobacterium SM1_4_3]|nr:TetR/AcrR family transcriptional regulator [Leptolyngbyaceae cyanobacterium SM1_4_3]